jgi:purine-binding chemotaxis protein CheW
VSELQVVAFNLNNQVLGADALQVQEVLKYQHIDKVPGLPDFLDGEITLRGIQIPVVNLNKRFNLGDTEITPNTKIIVTRIKNNYVGFVVNGISEIGKISRENMELPPDVLKKAGINFIKCIGKTGDRLILILDLEKILTQCEIESINSINE